MVRFLVGTMLEVGEGRRDPAVIAQLLKESDNSNVAPPAPPHALFLEKVEYPRHLYLDTQ
jgi:tRNA pseudouridine38-40 synthase